MLRKACRLLKINLTSWKTVALLCLIILLLEDFVGWTFSMKVLGVMKLNKHASRHILLLKAARFSFHFTTG